jgi:hypothetical protein
MAGVFQDSLIAGLTRSALDSADRLCQMALADALEEAGDPRGDVLRFGLDLASVSFRDEPRSDVPVREWDEDKEALNGRIYVRSRNSRTEWPRLPAPIPPGRTFIGRRATWRGVHRLGRLIACHMAEVKNDKIYYFRDIIACRLFACHLISQRVRDDAFGRFEGRQISFNNELRPCRTGAFLCYRTQGETFVSRVHCFRDKALRYSYALDIMDYVAANAPWDAAVASRNLTPVLV